VLADSWWGTHGYVLCCPPEPSRPSSGTLAFDETVVEQDPSGSTVAW